MKLFESNSNIEDIIVVDDDGMDWCDAIHQSIIDSITSDGETYHL